MTELKVGTKLHVRELFTFHAVILRGYAIDMGSTLEIVEFFPETVGPAKYAVKVLKFTRGHSAEFSKRGAQQTPAGTEFGIDDKWIEEYCEVLGE